MTGVQTCALSDLVTGRKKGRIELEYYGLDDLNDLLEALALLKTSRKGPEA